jgi:hypothetical protein
MNSISKFVVDEQKLCNSEICNFDFDEMRRGHIEMECHYKNEGTGENGLGLFNGS